MSQENDVRDHLVAGLLQIIRSRHLTVDRMARFAFIPAYVVRDVENGTRLGDVPARYLLAYARTLGLRPLLMARSAPDHAGAPLLNQELARMTPAIARGLAHLPQPTVFGSTEEDRADMNHRLVSLLAYLAEKARAALAEGRTSRDAWFMGRYKGQPRLDLLLETGALPSSVTLHHLRDFAEDLQLQVSLIIT